MVEEKNYLIMKTLCIKNGEVLVDGLEFAQTDVHIDQGCISFTDKKDSSSLCIDAQGLLVLPGIVDLHGDAFERQLMPRPGVNFGLESALLETDSQMIANGITTAYHGLTYSWEPGLRGAEAAREFVQGLAGMQAQLRVDTRLHLRHETYNLSAEAEIINWMREGRIDLLAFNDHMEHIEKQVHKPAKLSVYAGRTNLSPDQFMDLHGRVKADREQVPASIRRIAQVAKACEIPMASHDDESPEGRAWYEELACRICEFPVDLETALYAHEKGDPVIMGAPNVMRGGSHCGRLSAVESIAAGACGILTSDYYYPTLPLAAFKLARENFLSLGDAWNLISKNPAAAVNKEDRGTISDGKRADLLLLDTSSSVPLVKAVIVAGELQYMTNLSDRLSF